MGYADMTLEGNVGKEPELRFTPGGDPVCNMSVAVTPRKKVNDQWVDGETTWFRVTAWGRLAESCTEHVQKGDAIMVRGKFRLSTYEKDGETRTMPEVIADTVGKLVARIPKAEPKTINKSEDGPAW
jgi:single-strand DNA-binding protein